MRNFDHAADHACEILTMQLTMHAKFLTMQLTMHAKFLTMQLRARCKEIPVAVLVLPRRRLERPRDAMRWACDGGRDASIS